MVLLSCWYLEDSLNHTRVKSWNVCTSVRFCLYFSVFTVLADMPFICMKGGLVHMFALRFNEKNWTLKEMANKQHISVRLTKDEVVWEFNEVVMKSNVHDFQWWSKSPFCLYMWECTCYFLAGISENNNGMILPRLILFNLYILSVPSHTHVGYHTYSPIRWPQI